MTVTVEVERKNVGMPMAVPKGLAVGIFDGEFWAIDALALGENADQGAVDPLRLPKRARDVRQRRLPAAGCGDGQQHRLDRLGRRFATTHRHADLQRVGWPPVEYALRPGRLAPAVTFPPR